MSAAIVGAVIGAMGALLVALLVYRLAESSRKEARDFDQREQTKKEALSKEDAQRERERDALGRVTFLVYDQRVISNPSMRDLPKYGNETIGKLREVVLQAQGGLPPQSAGHPILVAVQEISGELRETYRLLQRPIGAPDPLPVIVEDWGPALDEFRARFAPLLDQLEDVVGPTSPKFLGGIA